MSFSVIVTVGPSILSKLDMIQKIEKLGNIIFRINGAHVDGEKAEEIVHLIRNHSQDAKIMIDLPGNKIRTSDLSQPIQLKQNEVILLSPKDLNFQDFYKYLKLGDKVYANDSTQRFEVEAIKGDKIYLKSFSDGELLRNKGIHVHGIHKDLPFLFDRDLDLIKTAAKLGVEYLSLSFVRHKNDVKEALGIISDLQDHSMKIIAKIETQAALDNLEDILSVTNIVNIDRGDLSADIGLMKLADSQKRVIKEAINSKRDVYIATQFLKNMELNPIPLLSEVVDLQNTIKLGVSGIQLSEETAVGRYPLEATKFVFDSFNYIFKND